jgi:hypothetical protein
LAFAEAVALADSLEERRGDAVAQALAFEARMGAEIAGRYRLSLARDRACLRAYRGEPAWDASDGGEGFIATSVIPAASRDAEVFRAVRRREAQLDPVGALAENETVLARARALEAEMPPTAPPGPTREYLLRAIATARLSEAV